MVVEVLVLGRQEGRLDAVRNGLDGEIQTALAREFGHQLAVRGMNLGGYRRFVTGEPLIIGQILRDMADIKADTCRCQKRQHDAHTEKISDYAYHALSSVTASP